MSQTQVVQARVNREIKAQAADALAAMGLSVSDAIRILLTKVAREKSMPAELFTPNNVTAAAILESEKNDLPCFNSVNELFKELNSDD